MSGAVIEHLAIESLDTTPASLVRAELRADVVDVYAASMREQAEFPPLLVVSDGETHWLADGRHRLEAHRLAGPGKPIACLVHEGDELAAIRLAIAANGAHGLRRSGADLRRAFEAAVARDLVDPTDAGGVQAVLRCSEAAAYRLTADHRARAKAERDQQINDQRAGGASQREIADQLGVNQATVSRSVMQNSQEKNASRKRPAPRSPARPPSQRPAPLPPPAAEPATREQRRAAGVAKIDVAVSYVYELADFDLAAAAAVLDVDQRDKLLYDLERCQRILANLTGDLGGGRPQ